ncbi:MAG: DUF4271 domain-containing protein [Gelidibacter sp.]
MLRTIISNEWFTVFIILGLCCITLSKHWFSSRFMDFIGVIGNSKYLKIYARDQKFIDGFDTLLFINLVISISVFGYYSYINLFTLGNFEIDVFLKLLFAVAALALIKILLERLIGSLFEIDKLIDAYLFQKTSYKNYCGFVLLPVNALILYTIAPSKIIIFSVIGLVFVINLIGFMTSFKNHQKLLLNNLFYFILYLCALEIGPYLILYKIIVEYKA